LQGLDVQAAIALQLANIGDEQLDAVFQ